MSAKPDGWLVNPHRVTPDKAPELVLAGLLHADVPVRVSGAAETHEYVVEAWRTHNGAVFAFVTPAPSSPPFYGDVGAAVRATVLEQLPGAVVIECWLDGFGLDAPTGVFGASYMSLDLRGVRRPADLDSLARLGLDLRGES